MVSPALAWATAKAPREDLETLAEFLHAKLPTEDTAKLKTDLAVDGLVVLPELRARIRGVMRGAFQGDDG